MRDESSYKLHIFRPSAEHWTTGRFHLFDKMGMVVFRIRIRMLEKRLASDKTLPTKFARIIKIRPLYMS